MMKSRPPQLLYWLLMAAAGAMGGALLAWGTPPAQVGRFVLLSFAMGLVVALVSHLLLWRGQPFQLRRTLTPIVFFTWSGLAAEAFAHWL